MTRQSFGHSATADHGSAAGAYESSAAEPESQQDFVSSDTALADPFEAKSRTSDESSVDRPVFNKIFEEETEPDMKILDEAVNQLHEHGDNSRALRDIKNAATALNNSAQLFAFNHISYLAEAVEALVHALLHDEVKLTQDMIELLKDGVVVFQGLIYEDQDALKEARKIIDQIKHLLGQTDEEPSAESLLQDGAESSTQPDADASSIAVDGDDPIDKKGKVGEVVNYVKHLLSDDREELQN
ncbi:MAG: Hpt domain-containing protein [candidate division KSB1 bacterium]|nr:Hpt domain-containing protein [candidate division KSB1 bacterium]